MISSTTVLFLLLLMFLLEVDESLGAQTEIRKLEEATKIRRNLEGNEYKNSKTSTGPSVSPRCHQYERFKKMVTTNDYYPFSSSCTECKPPDYTYSCTVCQPPYYAHCEKCTYTWSCDNYNYYSPSNCREIKKCC